MSIGVKRGLTAIAIALLIAVFVDMARSLNQRPKVDTELSGPVFGGGTWSLAEHRGKRPILLSFFATWCGPCRMEYPHLVELQKKVAGKDVQIVLLTEEDAALIQQDEVLSKSPLTIVTGAGTAFAAFNVSSIPRTVLLNAKGEVELDVAGYSEGSMEQISKLLAAE